MAPKRKRSEVSTNQENAPERTTRSGRSPAKPVEVAKSTRASGSRSPRKRALHETKDAVQAAQDDDVERERPLKTRRITPVNAETERKVSGTTHGSEEIEVAQLLEETPTKTRRRKKRGAPIEDDLHNRDELPSTRGADDDDATLVNPPTPSRRALKRKKVTVEIVISSPPKANTPVSQLPLESFNEPPQPQCPPLHPMLHPPRIAHCLNAQKRAILQSLQQPRPIPPPLDLSSEPTTEEIARKQLNDLIQGAVARGEGNSCLLLGPRGSGKSMLLDQILADIAAKPIILRLSGWVQTSDKLALREIALQLLQQTGSSFLVEEEPPSGQAADEADDEVNPFLVHPEGPSDAQPMKLPPSSQLHALIPVLLTLGRPVVVILDAFDMFAMHPRQSLLYCLLDTVQSCHATPENRGIVVVGVTTRIDTIQLLEKRVKSRFSGRTIRTAPPSTLNDWLALTRSILQVPVVSEERNDREAEDWQRQWNSSVDSFLESGEVVNIFNDTFNITKDVQILQRLLTRTILRLNANEPYLTPKHILSSVDSQRTRPNTLHFNNLSYPTICLLIASVHANTAGHTSFTFEMLFEKFRDQLRSSTSAPVQVNGGHIGMVKCTREVLMTAYDSLKSAKVFIPTAAPSSSLAKEYVRHRSTLNREVIKKIVEKSGQVHLKKWFLKGGL